MNHLFSSEFSSGCESGWTVYLQQSSYVSKYDPTARKSCEDEEEDDLSMVSDASSGPPHFCEEEEYVNNKQIDNKSKSAGKSGGKRENTKEYRRHRKVEEQLCLLDDTASSPLFNFSSNNLTLGNNQDPMESIIDFSQGHSSTHFKSKSALKEHFGLFQDSVSGTQLQQNQWLEEKRVGMR